MKKHTLTWISAVAAMLASAGLSVRAQDTPPPPAPPMSGTDTATTTTTTTTTTSGKSLPADGPDYTALAPGTDFDYQQLKQAKAAGLDDDTVARIYKLSNITGVPFRDIFDAIERGETFYQLLDRYSLDISDIDDISDTKLQIAAYESAYEASAKSGLNGAASNQDAELQAHFDRFKQLNAAFPPTATPSTLTFDRASEVQTTTQTTDTTTVVRPVRPAPPKPVVVKPVRVIHHVTVVKTVAVRHTRVVRHRAVRHHQVHHHLPVYMRRGS